MRVRTLALVTAGAAALLAGLPAAAQTPAPPPSLESQLTFSGKQAGDFVVRGRIIGVLPDESASISAIGGDVKITDTWVPEVDFTYFITRNFALELIAATTRHSITATGTALGNVPVGRVSLLPPTLTVQYHPLPQSRISPYIGAGINYTFFYNSDAAGGAVNSVKYDDGFGWALQAGIDFYVTDRISVNLDVKKLFLSTDAHINGGAITAKTDINPWIVGVGMGYRF